MKTLHSRVVPSFVLLLLVAALPPATAAPGDVKRTFDIPCRYPAGLASDGTHFYLLDWRAATIHKLAVADGRVVDTWPAPTLRPHGLAFGDGRLYVSDDHGGGVFTLNPQTGTIENVFEAPGARPTGLAYGDGSLFLHEAKSQQIYRVMAADGTIENYFDAPTRSCTCLAWDGHYLWAADRVHDELYRIDPAREQVIGILDAPGPYAAGVCWHDGFLWNVDFQSRKLHQIVINDSEKHRLGDTRVARVEFLWACYNYGPGDLQPLQLYVAVPPTLPNQKLRGELTFTQPPTRIVTDQWGQRCAAFELDKVAGGTRVQLGYHVQAEVSAIRYLIDPRQTGTLQDIPDDIRRQYTADGARYRINSPFIRQTVKEVVGDEENPYWIARKIYNHLIDKLHYQMIGGWDIPAVVLERGSGSCSEYTFAFIALCRAAGLPARYQGSIVVRGDDACIDEAFHRWAEIYLPRYGWVPVDANRGDKEAPADQARGFGELANRFLITTVNGGASEYLGWGYNAEASYQATGYCKVEQENYGFWEPLAPTNERSDKSASVDGCARPGGAGAPSR